MLEEIKEVLISEKKQELQRRQQIDIEIKRLIDERDQKQQQAIETLSNLEMDMKAVSSKSFHRILHGREIKDLCSNYASVSNNTIEEIKKLNTKIESLYQQIHDLSHDEVLIEKEIEKIRQATSLEELGLSERTALQYIKNDEKKVVRAVFKSIKENQPLETSTDIDRNLNALFQTNLSPFVIAMQKINIDDLVKVLIDIGIDLEEDKIRFLKNLTDYAQSPDDFSFPVNPNQERTDRLDNNFYNQVEQDLANMKRYSAYPPMAISKIVTLAVLTSMAKANKQQKQNQK